MTFRRHLGKSVLVALAALTLFAAVGAGYFAFEAWRTEDYLFTPAGAAVVVFGYTLAFGFLPVVLFGAPLYAFLLSTGRASLLAAIGIGVAPGLGLYFVALDLGVMSAIGGLFVALCTHAACTIRPNNSLKRTNQSLRD
jgi:hypothetical protein